MKLLEFLEAVVPPGVLVAARKDDKFRHTTSKLHSELASAIVEHALTKTDTYFALAAYKQGWHKVNDKPRLRVGTNVDSLKALWFDIDFKDGYDGARAVVLALKEFSAATGMPAPSILVHSGGGIHAYWPLDRAIPLPRWQKLADALKAAAKQQGLRADLACTGDSCRVLRPPGTVNWKDPANPKRVKILYSSGVTYDPDQLDALLSRFGVSHAVPDDGFSEFTAGVGKKKEDFPKAFFENVIKHCAVSRHVAETHGKEQSEPEWVAILQLLKHCEDGELWVHAVSDGHPGYSAQSTSEKWAQRLENTAGPTLCSTFEQFHSGICSKCPHRGFIKTPVQVGGEQAPSDVGGHPWGWRTSNDGKSTERLMVNAEGEKEWIRAISYVFDNFRTTRSVSTDQVEHRLDVPGVINDLAIPGECLGNMHKLVEHMALYGVAFRGKEAAAFKDLMSTWLKKLQDGKREAEVTEKLGWVIKDKQHVGFSAGQTTFYADGRVRNDVRTAREYAHIAEHYEPTGELAAWRRVADFLTEQNNPAHVAMLASAFASPLLTMTGVPGAILSFVSSESGVGKSSAMRVAQAVWGSPTHGINAVDDTPASVARKTGYLNNLPTYWDELRGTHVMERFVPLAYQITQGKERTRLNASAHMQAVQTWGTLLVCASNESVFDWMSSYSVGSDAGVVRVFEITVPQFAETRRNAEISIMFESLSRNFGHAGRAYAQYIAQNVDQVIRRVQSMRQKIGEAVNESRVERFWFSTIAALVVGSQLAKEAGVVDIDVKELTRYLCGNVNVLRGRSGQSMQTSDPFEIFATYMQQHQDKQLTVDRFPTPKQNTSGYIPELVGGPPKSNKIVCHVSRDEHLVRFALSDFRRWMVTRDYPESMVWKTIAAIGGKERRGLLGIGTAYEIPTRQRLIEVPTTPSASVEELVEDV